MCIIWHNITGILMRQNLILVLTISDSSNQNYNPKTGKTKKAHDYRARKGPTQN